MTTRQQILRSATPGQTPTAGSRMPGELWTTFPDLQLGVIDATKTAQKLIAVRFFSTTANYVVGDFVVQAGVLYVANAAVTAGAFNISKWNKLVLMSDITSALAAYLPLAGGTLTGALTLAADPGVALGAATKQYVDGKVTAAPFLPLAGGTLTGLVTLSGPPTVPLHAVTKAYADSGAFVPIGGGTMTGDLILNRDAQVALGAATFEQVNARGAGDNRLINGDMRIDQRNAGASSTASGYTIDRWGYGTNQANKGGWGRNITSIAAPASFPYYLGFVSSSAYTVVAGDFFNFYQFLEADAVSDFAWGTLNAQPVTLSFWALSNVSGTYSGCISNFANTRGYPFTFSLPTVAVWTKIVVTIPGDTAGTWVMSGNAGSIAVRFDLGTSTTYRGAAGAWANGNLIGATGAVSVVAVNGATFYVTGVKLEVGTVATPFNRQSLAKSLADCQRYYINANNTLISMAGNATTAVAGAYWGVWSAPVTMRAAPTIAASYGAPVSNAAAGTVTALSDNRTIQFGANSQAAGFFYITIGIGGLSAEL